MYWERHNALPVDTSTQPRCISRKKVQKDLVEAEATLERFTW